LLAHFWVSFGGKQFHDIDTEVDGKWDVFVEFGGTDVSTASTHEAHRYHAWRGERLPFIEYTDVII
jgi:hypothetical protein